MGTYTNFIQEIKGYEFGGFNAIEYADGGQEIYLSFKALLKWIGENINMYSNEEEVIRIDWESNKPMFMYSTSVSCNLQTCYIRNGYLDTTPGTISSTNTGIGSFRPIETFDNDADDKYGKLIFAARKNANVNSDPSLYPYIGNINNIYLNIAMLSQQTRASEESKGDTKISIREYLQNICNAVNKALGSINDLQVISDVDQGIETLTIIDYQQKRIRGLVKDANVTTIKAQGLGSMLTAIQAQSSITPEIATMISVGAQAQGSAVGVEATSFSKLSAGLKDRIYPTKGIGEEGKQGKQQPDPLKDRFSGALKSYMELVGNQVPTLGDTFGPVTLESTDKSNIENIAVEFYKSALATFTETGQASTALIPIKLDFTLYGISGLKIFQKFKLSNDVLPISYKGEFDFIVMGVSHTVNNSTWETKISSIISIKDQNLDKKTGTHIPVTVPLIDPASRINVTSGLTGGLPLNEDPAPLINPNRIGNSGPSNSPVAKDLASLGYKNALLPMAPVPVLEFIKEARGASKSYIDPATKKPGYALHPAAADAWKKAKAELDSKGIYCQVYSAYRDIDHQRGLSKKAGGGPTVAKGGTSAHGWGMAVDLQPLRGLIKESPAGGLQANLKARKTQTYKDIATVLAKYEWYNPWRLSDASGTVDEVWHFEYWGSAKVASKYY